MAFQYKQTGHCEVWQLHEKGKRIMCTCQWLDLYEPNRQLLNGFCSADRLPAGRRDRFTKHRLTGFFFLPFSFIPLYFLCTSHTLSIHQHPSLPFFYPFTCVSAPASLSSLCLTLPKLAILFLTVCPPLTSPATLLHPAFSHNPSHLSIFPSPPPSLPVPLL